MDLQLFWAEVIKVAEEFHDPSTLLHSSVCPGTHICMHTHTKTTLSHYNGGDQRQMTKGEHAKY